MNWKYLLPLPLAALAVATPIRVPKLQAPLPQLENTNCGYQWALHRYLDAYAYAAENPDLSTRLLQSAEKELARCGQEAEPLKQRISGLRQALFP